MTRTTADRLWTRLLSGLVFACVLTADGYAAGEAKSTVPNFSSIDRPWVATQGDYLPPVSGTGPVTYDHAHPVMVRVPNNAGVAVETPLRIADVSNPNLKPWVVDALKKSNDELLAGKLRWTARANCWPAGVPEFLLYAGGAESIYMIQTPKEVLMIHQADNETRHIYLDVPHSARRAPSWYGESVGHYEGDELVVDTVGFNDRTFLDDHYDVPHTTQLHVIERFKLLNEGNMLQVSFTVDDPDAFNAPWSGMVRYQHARTPATLVEEPCAENNMGHPGNFFRFRSQRKRIFDSEHTRSGAEIEDFICNHRSAHGGCGNLGRRIFLVRQHGTGSNGGEARRAAAGIRSRSELAQNAGELQGAICFRHHNRSAGQCVADDAAGPGAGRRPEGCRAADHDLRSQRQLHPRLGRARSGL
jgi:hypothetical protein